MSKKEEKCEQAVLEYLVSNNRPYCVNDIVQNLHNAFNKAAITRAIDSLVENGSVREKTYNKQKIYWVSQDRFATVNDGAIKELERKAAELSQQREKLEVEIGIKQSKLDHFVSFASVVDTEKEMESLMQEIGQLEKRLEECKSTSVDPTELKKVKDEYDALAAQWKKRKRIAREALSTIEEHYDGSKQDLMDEAGYDVDDYELKY